MTKHKGLWLCILLAPQTLKQRPSIFAASMPIIRNKTLTNTTLWHIKEFIKIYTSLFVFSKKNGKVKDIEKLQKFMRRIYRVENGVTDQFWPITLQSFKLSLNFAKQKQCYYYNKNFRLLVYLGETTRCRIQQKFAFLESSEKPLNSHRYTNCMKISQPLRNK